MNKKGADTIMYVFAFVGVLLLFSLYFVLGFENTPRAECIFPVEMDCVGFQTTNQTHNTIAVQLKNNLYETVNITHASVADSSCSYSFTPIKNGSREWPADRILWISFHCNNVSPENHYALINVEVRSLFDDRPLRYTGKVSFYG